MREVLTREMFRLRNLSITESIRSPQNLRGGSFSDIDAVRFLSAKWHIKWRI